MAHIVRVWLVTPPVVYDHPKTEILRIASRQATIALHARKIDARGAMRVVARGLPERLSAFAADLSHKVREEGWAGVELELMPEDVDSVSGGELRIVRTEDVVSSGADSSGRAPPPAAGAVSPVDSGSTASGRIIVAEVRRERERGVALMAAALEAAAAREAAALEAAAAREAAALEAAAAREAAALEAAAAREAATREFSISTLMRLAHLSRADAEKALGTAQ